MTAELNTVLVYPQDLQVDSLECFLGNLVAVVKGGTPINDVILNGAKMFLARYLIHL